MPENHAAFNCSKQHSNSVKSGVDLVAGFSVYESLFVAKNAKNA